MFAREGLTLILIAVLIGLGLLGIAYFVPPKWRYVLGVLAVVIVGFTLFFFREPTRTAPAVTEDLLLAPADGKVIAIEAVEHPYIEGPAKQLSIFLSPLDVHVNWVPADGVIESAEYVEGEYLVAWHPKSSELNERSIFQLKHPSGTRLIFKQITGYVARRIAFDLQTGDTVKAGQRFGIMKFGSRMDIILPAHLDLLVKEGDRVTGVETVLGRIPPAGEVQE